MVRSANIRSSIGRRSTVLAKYDFRSIPISIGSISIGLTVDRSKQITIFQSLFALFLINKQGKLVKKCRFQPLAREKNSNMSLRSNNRLKTKFCTYFLAFCGFLCQFSMIFVTVDQIAKCHTIFDRSRSIPNLKIRSSICHDPPKFAIFDRSIDLRSWIGPSLLQNIIIFSIVTQLYH